MINAKIQFSWNVGAGVGKVTSDLPIQNENNFINTIDKWYHVKADRYVTIFLKCPLFFIFISIHQYEIKMLTYLDYFIFLSVENI